MFSLLEIFIYTFTVLLPSIYFLCRYTVQCILIQFFGRNKLSITIQTQFKIGILYHSLHNPIDVMMINASLSRVCLFVLLFIINIFILLFVSLGNQWVGYLKKIYIKLLLKSMRRVAAWLN